MAWVGAQGLGPELPITFQGTQDQAVTGGLWLQALGRACTPCHPLWATSTTTAPGWPVPPTHSSGDPVRVRPVVGRQAGVGEGVL